MPFKNSSIALYVLAGAVFALAVALGYFAYVLASLTKDLPDLLSQLESTEEAIDPVIREVTEVRLLMPEILAEVEAVRLAIPPILEEVGHSRQQLPAVLDEVARLRQEVPGILAEADAVLADVEPILREVQTLRRETMPAILSESSSLRTETLPMLLEEIDRLHREIPVYLNRADSLVEDANQAGMRASEGAVTGLFTGIFRAPVSLFGEMGRVLPGGAGISAADRELLAVETILLLEMDEPGTKRAFEYPSDDFEGVITLLDVSKRKQQVQKRIRLEATKDGREVLDEELLLTRQPSGEWEVLDSSQR